MQHFIALGRAAISLWEVISPLYSALAERKSGVLYPVASLNKRDTDILERVQHRATMMMKGLEHLFCQEKSSMSILSLLLTEIFYLLSGVVNMDSLRGNHS